MNCFGSRRICGLLLASLVDVSPVCELSRGICAVLSFSGTACDYVFVFIVDICIYCGLFCMSANIQFMEPVNLLSPDK